MSDEVRATSWTYDATIDRPQVDPEILSRARDGRLAEETPMERYLRQQWEVATAAARVALDALRRMWPLEAAHLQESDGAYEIEAALVHATKLSEHLALAAKDVIGDLMYEAEMGRGTLEDPRQ